MEQEAKENQDESMESILKSIKSIISGKGDDTKKQKSEGGMKEAAQKKVEDDVLELTDRIPDDNKPPEPAAQPAVEIMHEQKAPEPEKHPEPEPQIMPSNPPPQAKPVSNDVLSNIDQALEAPPVEVTPVPVVTPPPAPVIEEPTIIEVAPPPPPPPPPPPVQEMPKPEVKAQPAPQQKFEQPAINTTNIPQSELISSEIAKTSMEKLKSLMDSIPKPKIDSPNLRSGQTLEDIVVESLKPMMAEWLNQNLPVIVQQMVEKEIKKIVPKD